jgi:hypothetical protein
LEQYTLFNHKNVIKEKLPPIYKTTFSPGVLYVGFERPDVCSGLVVLLDFFSVGLCVLKNINVPPNALVKCV